MAYGSGAGEFPCLGEDDVSPLTHKTIGGAIMRCEVEEQRRSRIGVTDMVRRLAHTSARTHRKLGLRFARGLLIYAEVG
jgi:hypothetical protein